VDRPLPITRSEIEQHLENELSDECTVLAAAVANDPGIIVLGKIFLADVGLSGSEPIKRSVTYGRELFKHAIPVAFSIRNVAFAEFFG